VAAATAAVPKPIGPPAVLDENAAASAGVAPAVAGASPTTVKLAVPYPSICGRPAAGTLAIAFPRGELVPGTIAASAVHVANARTKSVHVSGRTVTVTLSPLPTAGTQVTCHSIALRRLTLTFGAAAQLGNPAAAGTYSVTVKHGSTSYAASFKLTA
jgi:hypothetical protein